MKKQNQRTDWIGLSEAGEILGVTRQRVHQLIEAYGLSSKKLAPRFTVICRAEIARLEKLRDSAGTAIYKRKENR